MLFDLPCAAAFALCAIPLLIGGCASYNSESGSTRAIATRPPAAPPPPQPTIGDMHFAPAYRKVRGQVVIIAPATKSNPQAHITISHENIPNFMEAMRMSMPLRNAEDARRFKKGDKIRFDLIRRGGTYFVENASVLPSTTALKLSF